ncbi:MAG: hypothetical protein KDI79_03920, partial [Anaerolineae bacterium]|nr:hypothetical protein [Anaerolineae bacterium]
DVFQRTWGVKMGQVRDMAATEMNYFVREYRDLIYEAPFQFPVDLLFSLRAIGILSGMATNLDPNFDPWAEIMPFAQRMAQDELQKNWQGWLREAVVLAQTFLKLPTQIDRILTDFERGNVIVQTALAPSARKSIERLEKSVNRLSWVVLAVGLLVAGTTVNTGGDDGSLGGWLMGLSVVVLVWGLLKEW